VTHRLAPAHVIAGGLCAGLAAANVERIGAPVLLALPAAAAALALREPTARLVALALVAALACWWWGGMRL